MAFPDISRSALVYALKLESRLIPADLSSSEMALNLLTLLSLFDSDCEKNY